MKNFLITLGSVAMLCVVQSCNNAPKEPAQVVAKEPQSANDSLFTIKEGGYEFAIYLPKDLMIENTPEIDFNSATGDMHIRIGEKFWIIASQENKDMASLKEEISENMLFSSRVIEESANTLLYQRLLPDGKAYDYNFRSLSSIGGKPYFFRTCEEGEYSKESVDLMRTAIMSAHSAV